MDDSRRIDLKRLQEKIDDPATSPARREQLLGTKDAIIEQSRDKRISETRQRLINAARAGDAKEVEKLQSQLEESDKRKGYDVYKDTHNRH